jgi:hypothetical protein
MSNVKSVTVQELYTLIENLTERVKNLEEKSVTKSNAPSREMTDDDAKSILFGDYKTLTHKQAAEKLNLSYGQIYSCRLQFTFKHIHKYMRDNNIPNIFVK